MTRKEPAPKAQRRRLAETVRLLAKQLERPVCSTDLRTFYRKNPAEHPLLIQALGQLLFKASRPPPAPVIVPIGLIGKFAYYAPDANPRWTERLEIHRLQAKAGREIEEDLPRSVGLLLDSPLHAIAANALAGFTDDWAACADDPRMAGWDRIDELRELVALAQAGRAAQFRWDPPTDLLARKAAEKHLQREYQGRADAEHALSLYRHLAALAWLSERFAGPSGKARFSRVQIKCYAESRWGWDALQKEQARSLVLALRYGLGGFRGTIIYENTDSPSEP